MPKAILKIEDFSGGQNNFADPRDIEDNQLAVVTDATVDEGGVIRMMGGFATHGSTNINDTSQGAFAIKADGGYGLHFFSSDYDGLAAMSSGVASASVAATNYFIMTDNDSAAKIYVYSTATANNNRVEVVDFGDTASNLVFYNVDGALRVIDGSFASGNTNKWVGFISRKRYEDKSIGGSSNQDHDTSGTDIAGDLGPSWFALNQEITGPTAVTSSASADNAGAVHAVHVRITDATDTSGETYGWNTDWDVACSFVYDGWQESPLTISGSAAFNPVSNDTDKVCISLYLHQASTEATTTINPRITAINIYMKEATDDIWYLQGEVDMYHGFINRTFMNTHGGWFATETKTYAPSGTNTNAGHNLLYPLKAITYEGNSGLQVTDTTLAAKFKTAVVANRRVYAGNVQYTNKADMVVIEGDSIMKTDVNAFDSFTEDSIIEASNHDGDEIIKLEVYGDRLLQFKTNKLEIINIAEDIEWLEDSFNYKGVSHPGSVCKTDYGIAWANQIGCYLFDGEKVVNLLENVAEGTVGGGGGFRGGSGGSTADAWQDWIGTYPMVGYVPANRQLVVVNSSKNGDTNSRDIYLFDMITGAWSQGDTKIPNASADITNFINDQNGDLVMAQVASGPQFTFYKWDPAPDASSNLNIVTKDYDFGEPGRRKKIYKVYLTFKGNGENVAVEYGVNGLAPASTFFKITSGTDGSTSGAVDGTNAKHCIDYDAETTDWLTAELKPSSAINNIYSFQLKISSEGSVAADFAINDISIVYRMKGIK